MSITLSFLDSVLYEIQNKETKKKKKKKKKKREEEFSIDWLVGTVNIEWSIQSIKQMISFSSKFMVIDL